MSNQESRKTLPAPFQLLDFRLASFCDMDLREQEFICCDLRLADFRRANLEGATFVNCDLRGTNFIGANMTNVEMPNSIYNSKPVQSGDEKERQDKRAREILKWNVDDLRTGEISCLLQSQDRRKGNLSFIAFLIIPIMIGAMIHFSLTVLIVATALGSVLWYVTHPGEQVSFLKGKAMDMKAFIILWVLAAIISSILNFYYPEWFDTTSKESIPKAGEAIDGS